MRLLPFAKTCVVLTMACVLGLCGCSSDESSSQEQTQPNLDLDLDYHGYEAPELLNQDVWGARMSLPSSDETKSFAASQRSPYIVCRPEFANATGYTEYAVDFKVDAQPRGTYLSICNFDIDLGELSSRYGDVHREYQGVGAYAGFQVLEDGSRVAIMSVWDTYLTDANGESVTLRATKTYPENPRVSGEFGGEGQGVQTIVDYDWKQGNPYRALIQCGQTDAGTCELLFMVCDLTTGRWDKLISYDLGFGNTYMKSACCFLEDYLTQSAADVRTMELGNFRVKSVETGLWVSATAATMEEDFEYPGSYNYGSDGTCFWAITSGIPGLCSAPANYQRFEVSAVESGAPYEPGL